MFSALYFEFFFGLHVQQKRHWPFATILLLAGLEACLFNDFHPRLSSWTPRQIQTRNHPTLWVTVLKQRRKPLRPPTQIWIWLTTVVIKKKYPHPLHWVQVLLHDPDHHHQGTRRIARYVWNHCKWMLQRMNVWFVVEKDCINIVVKVLMKVQ